MKSLLKMAVFALVMGVMLYGFDALAAEDVFTRALRALGTVFRNVRVIVYVLGAFGLIGIAVMFILGKMQLKWLALLAIGLAIVAAADAVVTYATKSGSSGGVTDDITGRWETELERS